jgi:site-specific DNA-adenine methylase
MEATWFVDPPYNNKAGSHYKCGSKDIDYNNLAEWCRSRRGQVMVCENAGATWLPFEDLYEHVGASRVGNKPKRSVEAIWTNE